MNDDPAAVAALAAIRQAFDDQFQRAPEDHADAEQEDGVLLIGVAGQRFAVPTADIGGVYRCPPITPVPSAAPALLGVAGVHGAVVAVYGLARLLDLGDPPPGPWLVLRAADRSTALVVDEVSGLARLPRTAIDSGRIAIGADRRTVIRLGAVLGLPPTLGRG